MTEQQLVKSWLASKQWKQICVLSIVSLLLLLGAVVVLIITWWVVYGTLWFIVDAFLPEWRYLIPYVSTGVVVLLFHGFLTGNRNDLTEYSFTTGTAHDEPVTVYVPGVGLGSTINPLAPDSAHSYVKMIVSLLYTGPEMCAALWRHLARMYYWITLNREGVAKALSYLLSRDDRTPANELVGMLPAGHNPSTILRQLMNIEGVLFLKNEGPAFRPTSSLRDEFKQYRERSL